MPANIVTTNFASAVANLSDLTIDEDKDWGGFNQTNHGGLVMAAVETGNNNKINWAGGHTSKYIQHRSNTIEHSSFSGHKILVYDGSSYAQALRIVQKSNILISKNLSAVGTSGDTVLCIENGVAPTTSPANAIQLYSEDVTASAELKVMDEATNVTVLSPHAFDDPKFPIPRETSMDFMYRSENLMLGKGIAINMAKAVRMIEKLADKVKELDPTFEIEQLTNVYDLPTQPLDWNEQEEQKRIKREQEKVEISQREEDLPVPPNYEKKPRPSWLDLPSKKE